MTSIKLKIYAFIDSQNLNLGTSKDIFHGRKLIYKRSLKTSFESGAYKLVYKGWKLDFKKFRIYLSDKFRVDKVFLCIGYIKQNKGLYKKLKNDGYELIFKPTVKDHKGKSKGNVDAELVLHAAAIEFPKYDKAVVVSGDGDFYCLHEYLEKNHKLLQIIIPNSKSESSLLRPFQKYKTFIEFEKKKLEK